MAIDLTKTGLDRDDPEVKALLRDLQGNILKYHGRENSASLLVTFGRRKRHDVSTWVREFARERLTSAEKQREAARLFRETRVDGGLFGGFYLSATGYDALGFAPDQIPRDHGQRFLGGMGDSRGRLGDPKAEELEPGYQRPIHALVLLAHQDLDRLREAIKREIDLITPFASFLSVEYGSSWKDREHRSIEPFGYDDKISDPLFFKDEIEAKGPQKNYDPAAPANLVLVREPATITGHSGYGSFLVFRKLQQNVAGFQDHVANLSRSTGLPASLIGAYAVGRFRDGTPVALSETPQPGPPANDFNYAGDPHGVRCPFHAHTRKMNPRGDTERLTGVSPELERSRLIVRRSMVFGQQPKAGALPDGPVGLLFAAFQADIRSQFEFLQQSWAGQVHFPVQKTGLDPIAGQGTALLGGLAIPKVYGKPEAGVHRRDFASFVKLRGGEYFFAPSVGFLKNL